MKINKSEIATITISLSAISVSAAVFFYQFLDISQELKGSILNLNLKKDKFSAQLALTNTGNQQTLLSKVELITFKGDDSAQSHVLNDNMLSDSLAIAFKPGELQVRSIRFRFDPKAMYDFGGPPDAEFGHYPEARKVRIALSFLAMDSNGEVFQSQLVFLHVHTDSSNIRGYTAFFKAIDLLESERPTTKETVFLVK